VADAVDDSDAITLAQFNTFKTTATASVSDEVDALDVRLAGLESRLTDLVDRLEAVAAQID
jgi:chaperonin cofactor prefoldin